VNERRSAVESGDQSMGTILAAESLRNSAPVGAPAKREDGPSALWKVFGGTLLSVGALAIITLCQHFNGRLNALQADINYQSTDLRKDLIHLGEAQAELLKKEEFNNRLKSVWDSLKELHDAAPLLSALKERAALTEQQLRVGAEERKELMRQVQQLREKRAADQERREMLAELQALRERLAALEGRKHDKPAAGIDE